MAPSSHLAVPHGPFPVLDPKQSTGYKARADTEVLAIML